MRLQMNSLVLIEREIPDTLESMKNDIALLVLRLGFGGSMFFAHGLPKLMSFSEKSESFADPLGIGPLMSLILAVFAEVFCSMGVMLGALTRLASIPCLITMLVAAVLVHADDPWQKKELAAMYGIAFFYLMLVGGGKFSIDSFALKKKT
jgi:putative oxidoreductase